MASNSGEAIHKLISRLFPLCRSITGNGVRQTLDVLGEYLPLTACEVPSGTQVFDWVVPREWNIRDAWIKNSAGERVVDFRKSNLHVLNYSIPVQGRMPLHELRSHLYTLPEQPDLVPYRTSYYEEKWGFCLSQNALDALPEAEYDVCIESSLEEGSLSYGELLIPGTTPEEVLISCHICHPSLANDNLSAVAVATYLARFLMEGATRTPQRYSYRFLFVPATIGSLAWLSRNPDAVSRIRHGLTLCCLGDDGAFRYKQSRRADAEIDHAVELALESEAKSSVEAFSPYGYDERQYCSPGFNLPVGRLSRSAHGKYDEYHTSADNLALMTPASLEGSLELCKRIVRTLEGNGRYYNSKPQGEPQLGKYGLYANTGGDADVPLTQLALLWVLNQSDGDHSLVDIALRAGLSFDEIRVAADALLASGLLQDNEPPSS